MIDHKKISLQLGGSISPSLKAATGGTIKQLNKISKAHKKLKDDHSLVSKVNADKQALESTRTTFKKQVSQLKALQHQYKETGSRDKSLASQIKKQNKLVEKTNIGLNKQRLGFKGLRQELGKASIKTSDLKS